MTPPKLTVAVGCFLMAAASSAFVAAQTTPMTPESPAASPAIAQVPADPSESARRITAADARQALAKGEAVLVDVRSKEAYTAEHAQGAITIPLGEVTTRAGELPKDKLIITYCT